MYSIHFHLSMLDITMAAASKNETIPAAAPSQEELAIKHPLQTSPIDNADWAETNALPPAN
ncbi:MULTISPECIES: hypothetical protein [Paenibacillus]|uniref:Uncharacterized protein n=1 Tax=Paenibacillus anseongense TaxID=2682845 RepID=A0ABW9U6L7_9BACL|nr:MULTISPECIES: hypothetical protein [Paenibacillus]MBA2940481.1 hypothetical protein [Paenibacillus sp. CGMCC 1.16610]MVQ35658.1 hypothetical protein [Paenibacillus anseongense]